MQRSYPLNITASDKGSPSLLPNIAFLVTVKDANSYASAIPRSVPLIPPIHLFWQRWATL